MSRMKARCRSRARPPDSGSTPPPPRPTRRRPPPSQPPTRQRRSQRHAYRYASSQPPIRYGVSPRAAKDGSRTHRLSLRPGALVAKRPMRPFSVQPSNRPADGFSWQFYSSRAIWHAAATPTSRPPLRLGRSQRPPPRSPGHVRYRTRPQPLDALDSDKRRRPHQLPRSHESPARTKRRSPARRPGCHGGTVVEP
jgi:hypothetical protein